MTNWSNIRLRPGSYNSVHVASGREFGVDFHPPSDTWRAEEITGDAGEQKSTPVLVGKEITSKRDLLAALHELITNPPAPPKPKPEWVPPPPKPPQPWQEPETNVPFTVTRIESGRYEYVAAGETYNVWTDEQGYWYGCKEGETQNFATGMESRKDLLKEFKLYIDPS